MDISEVKPNQIQSQNVTYNTEDSLQSEQLYNTKNGNLLSLHENSEINKYFLLQKFFQNSEEQKKAISGEVRPVPKPRKSKNIAAQKIVNPSYSNSTSSQKTYNVGEVRADNTKRVDVIVHENPVPSSNSKSSRRNSSDAGKTYIKTTSIKTEQFDKVDKASSHLEKTVDCESIIESNISVDESSKQKINENDPDGKEYNYEKIVEIIVHKTDALKIDSYVTHPTVKVHIVDVNTGRYYAKSNKNRSVVFYYENKEQDYILPVMTGAFNLQEKRTFTPEWEESILLNEDFGYLMNKNVILFFEVTDYIPLTSQKMHKLEKYCYKGWHRIAFAFLKIVGTRDVLNINKKLKLQLFYPKKCKNRDPSKCDLWYIWKSSKLGKYPAALYVTAKEVISHQKVIETFRSKTPLQKENISDLRNYKLSLKNVKIVNEAEVLSKVESNRQSNHSADTFELPSKPLAELNSYDNGCFILKFSNSGLYLACAVQIKSAFTIIVYEVNSFEEVYTINEHRGLIYSINWSLDDSLLITASADNTVVIWNFSKNSFLQILPHPIYVYASHINFDNTVIATGGYDATLRIWLYKKQEEKYELHQEMEKHEGYITSVCFSKISSNLYSSDSKGHIMVWSKLDNSDWRFERDISTPDLSNTVINELVLFPNEKKMLIHSRDSILRIISIKRACVLHWLQGALNSRIQTFCSITSCGSYVTSGSENGLVVVWDAKTGKDIATYEPFLSQLHLKTVHCAQFHPKDNFIAFSHYGSYSPILLYHYNDVKPDMKQKNRFCYGGNENGAHIDPKENVSFHSVLEKMDKLLN